MERRQGILAILNQNWGTWRGGSKEKKIEEGKTGRVQAVMNPGENQFNLREAGKCTTPCGDGHIWAPCGFCQ